MREPRGAPTEGLDDKRIACAWRHPGRGIWLRCAVLVGLPGLLFMTAAARPGPPMAPGDLDPTFGAGGRVTTAFPQGAAVNTSLAVGSDGSIVAAGRLEYPGVYRTWDFAVARYDPAGMLDTSFGVDGKVVTDFGSGCREMARAVAVQPDGRIVVVGWIDRGPFASVPYSGDPELPACQRLVGELVPRGSAFALARYNPDGALDSSFGMGGLLTTDFGPEANIAEAVALHPDGGIVAGGTTTLAGGPGVFALARYRPDGSLDPTFGAGGLVTTDFGSRSRIHALAVQPDGRLIAVGFVVRERSATGVRTNPDFALARYNQDGSLDPTFGAGGIVMTNLLIEGSGRDEVHSGDVAFAVAVQPDARLVVGGASDIDHALARYLPDGTLDHSFGVGGLTRLPVRPGVPGEVILLARIANGVVVQADGKIVAAGAEQGVPGGFWLARYEPDGALDAAFGNGGLLNTPFSGNASAQTLALQPDGKIVVSGNILVLDQAVWRGFALARYLP